jgi:hypothetical protein
MRGGLWIGARNALAYLKDGTLQESFTTVDGRPFGELSGIYSDAEGTLWAAAEAGLLRLRDGRLTMLTSANGLPCAPPVWWVTEDDDRSLWLSLNCGLARIRRPEVEAWVADTKRTVAVTVFDNADGVRQRWNPSKGYGPIATRSRDGKVWFIGMDGVGVIDPRRLSHNGLPPPVHIERIAANGKLYWQNLTAMAPSSLALPPVIRDLEIEFTALSLAVPDKVRFRYKLEGQDPDWKEVANERKVQYSNLAPGSYRFRVIASNNSGVWNEAGDALGFVVAPAYYQTTWFRALCVLALVALLYGLCCACARCREFSLTLTRAWPSARASHATCTIRCCRVMDCCIASRRSSCCFRRPGEGPPCFMRFTRRPRRSPKGDAVQGLRVGHR